MEIALVPLLPGWAEQVARIVEAINPYPITFDVGGSTLRPDEEESGDLDWTAISEAWVEVGFALLRAAREQHNEELWPNVVYGGSSGDPFLSQAVHKTDSFNDFS